MKLGTILSKLLLLSVVGLFITALCFWLMRKNKIQETNNSDTNQNEKMKPEPMLIFGMVIMLVNMIANEFAK